MKFQVIRSDVEPIHCPQCGRTRILQRDYYPLDYPVVGVRRGGEDPAVVVVDRVLNRYLLTRLMFESPRPNPDPEHQLLYCQSCEYEWPVPDDWELAVVPSASGSRYGAAPKRVK